MPKTYADDELESAMILRRIQRQRRQMFSAFSIIETLCGKYGTSIEIIDNTERTEEQELVEDLIQIVTVFSYKLQGKRAHKAKKMIKELMEDDKSSENAPTTD